MGLRMSILDRYITREFCVFFLIILMAVIGIFLSVDFFEKIDNFLESDVALTRAVVFFWFRIPFVVALIGPVALLLAILIVFSLMNKNNELIALRSNGVSPFHLLRMVFLIAVSGSILLFFLSDQIVPATVTKANRIWLEEVKGEKAVITREKNIWIKGMRTISHFKYFNHANSTLNGITVYYFDDDFRLRRRLDAASGQYKDGGWSFRNVMVQERRPNGFQVEHHDRLDESFEFKPEDLRGVVKRSEEMDFLELLQFIRDVEKEGYDANKFRVDLHAKLAFPFVCIILAIPAAGFAIQHRRREGMSVSIAYGMGITFIYYFLHNFSLSLGYGGMVPPALAAWVTNILFLGYGVVVMLGVDY